MVIYVISVDQLGVKFIVIIGNEMPNKELLDLLEQIKIIHEKKSQDYTSGGNYENFERSASIAEWFTGIHQSFAVLIGTKLARLSTLLAKKEAPNNESIEDSFLDLTTYCALWASYYKSQSPKVWDGQNWVPSIEKN